MRRAAVKREIGAPAAIAWGIFVDLDQWPNWGPSVRSAALDSGGRRLHDGATGRVVTAVGVSVPFAITEWRAGERWSWDVAGLPATSHTVRATGTHSCEAAFEVPWFAVPYLVVCRVALDRIAELSTSAVD